MCMSALSLTLANFFVLILVLDLCCIIVTNVEAYFINVYQKTTETNLIFNPRQHLAKQRETYGDLKTVTLRITLCVTKRCIQHWQRDKHIK